MQLSVAACPALKSEKCGVAFADKNLGVFTGFLAGFAWKGTETFKQARPAFKCTGFATCNL